MRQFVKMDSINQIKVKPTINPYRYWGKQHRKESQKEGKFFFKNCSDYISYIVKAYLKCLFPAQYNYLKNNAK